VSRKAWRALAGMVAGAIIIATPAHARNPLYVVKCNDWGSKRFSIEDRIDGCTAIILPGRYGRKNLARAYNNRGFAWTAKGDLARATADFDEALRLNPKLPLRNSKRRPPSVK
jgi:tetratricopeptide (TPR) repeat protein